MKDNPLLKFIGVPSAIVMLLALIGFALDSRYLLRAEAQASMYQQEKRWIFVCKKIGGADNECYGNLSEGR